MTGGERWRVRWTQVWIPQQFYKFWIAEEAQLMVFSCRSTPKSPKKQKGQLSLVENADKKRFDKNGQAELEPQAPTGPEVLT